MKTPTFLDIDSLKSYFVSAPMVNEYGSITDARTTAKIARWLLMDNEFIIKGSNIYYFAIKHIGLNVYCIKLRPKGRVNTFIVDAFENHLIEEAGTGRLPTSRY